MNSFSSFRRVAYSAKKSIDLGSFYKKRDDVGLLTNQLPTTTFPDIAKSPCAFKKEYEKGPRYPVNGQPRNIFSTGNTNNMGVILEEDRDDQMIFPWKELEKDFGIFTNHSPNQILDDFSKSSDRPALTSVPSPPSPAMSKKYVISNNLSADGDSTIPSFSWLDSQILNGPDIGSEAGLDTDKLRIGSLSMSEDGGKEFSENHLDNAFIDKNNAINGRFSTRYKQCQQSKDIISSTRHKHWSEEEDEMLRHAMASEKTPNWSDISLTYFHSTRSVSQCKNRWKNVSLYAGFNDGQLGQMRYIVTLMPFLGFYSFLTIQSIFSLVSFAVGGILPRTNSF